MKRDMNLIRELMLALENDESISDKSFPPHTPIEVAKHKELLIEADLIKGKVMYSTSPEGELYPHVAVQSITWNGHEFLDAARPEEVWENVMKKIAKKGGQVSLAILLPLLQETAKSYFA